MPLFQYVARTDDGTMVTETIAFRDEVALRHHLRKNNMFVLRIAERRRARIALRRKVRLGDLIIMARQLRTMVQAGMPLVTGLEALAVQATNPYLVEIMTEIGRAVGSGRSLGDTMAEYPLVFPEILVSLVKSGEQAGRLSENLTEASRQLELQMELRQKTISALIYPAFTMCATIGTLTIMMLFIVPVFKRIYDDLHATLPAPTLFLVWLSDVLLHDSWAVLLLLAALFIALRRFYRTPEGRLRLDALKLRLPLIGVLYRKSASANLTGSLAGLLESGVPLINALQTAANVCGNLVMAEAVRDIAHNVTLGRRLSDEMERSQQFPVMVHRMVGIAEDVGTLPQVLREIAKGYIEEVEYATRRIVTIIEPTMVLIVGGVVGFVLVALYYPIFNLGNVFLAGA